MRLRRGHVSHTHPEVYFIIGRGIPTEGIRNLISARIGFPADLELNDFQLHSPPVRTTL